MNSNRKFDFVCFCFISLKKSINELVLFSALLDTHKLLIFKFSDQLNRFGQCRLSMHLSFSKFLHRFSLKYLLFSIYRQMPIYMHHHGHMDHIHYHRQQCNHLAKVQYLNSLNKWNQFNFFFIIQKTSKQKHTNTYY